MNDPRGPATFAPDTDAPAFDHAALARDRRVAHHGRRALTARAVMRHRKRSGSPMRAC